MPRSLTSHLSLLMLIIQIWGSSILFPKTPSQSSASHTNQTPSSYWALLGHCVRLILLKVSITV